MKNFAQAGDVLIAISGSFTATSDSFTITPAAATKIVFVSASPTDTVAGAVLAPIVVRLEDDFGNVATREKSAAKLQIVTGPSGAKLSGATNVKPVNGIITFSAASLQTVGEYVLQVTYDKRSIESDRFNIL